MKTMKAITALLCLLFAGAWQPSQAAEQVIYYRLDHLGSPVAATEKKKGSTVVRVTRLASTGMAGTVARHGMERWPGMRRNWWPAWAGIRRLIEWGENANLVLISRSRKKMSNHSPWGLLRGSRLNHPRKGDKGDRFILSSEIRSVKSVFKN